MVLCPLVDMLSSNCVQYVDHDPYDQPSLDPVTRKKIGQVYNNELTFTTFHCLYSTIGLYNRELSLAYSCLLNEKEFVIKTHRSPVKVVNFFCMSDGCLYHDTSYPWAVFEFRYQMLEALYNNVTLSGKVATDEATSVNTVRVLILLRDAQKIIELFTQKGL